MRVPFQKKLKVAVEDSFEHGVLELASSPLDQVHDSENYRSATAKR